MMNSLCSYRQRIDGENRANHFEICDPGLGRTGAGSGQQKFLAHLSPLD